MIKDYIFAITNLTLFRESLLTSDSYLVSVTNGEGTIKSPTTLVSYNGNQSVATVRGSAEDLAEMDKFSSVVLCGEGVNVKDETDITWIDKDLYYSIYDISVPNTPIIHCVFA